MSGDRKEKRLRRARSRTLLPATPPAQSVFRLPTAVAQQLIDWHRRGYERIGNPLHVWAAYRIARKADEEIPTWVWRYFDSVGCALLDPVVRELSAADAAAAALEVDYGGGAHAFQEFADSRWIDYGALVTFCMAEGDQETYAIERVAKELGVSAPTVRRGLLKYRKVYQER